MRVEGGGHYCGGVIGAAAAEGSGNIVAVGGDEAGQDEEVDGRVVDAVLYDPGVGADEVHGGMAEAGVCADQFAGILPGIGDAGGIEAGGDDEGGQQFTIADDLVLGAGGEFAEQEYAAADVFDLVATGLYRAEDAALAGEGQEGADGFEVAVFYGL